MTHVPSGLMVCATAALGWWVGGRREIQHHAENFKLKVFYGEPRKSRVAFRSGRGSTYFYPSFQTWICSISSGANSFCPSPPKNSFRSPPVLPSTSRSMKKSRSCSTPEIRCYNCVNNGYGSKKFMIYWISTRHLYLATLPLPCFAYVVSFWLLAKKFKIMTWMHGHCHYDRVLSWSGAKQHSRRETPLLKSLHKIWCNAPRTCTRHQGVEQFFAPGAE